MAQPTYDFYRMLHSYGEEQAARSLSQVAREFNLFYVVIDDEWRAYENEMLREYISKCSNLVRTIEGIEVRKLERDCS